MWTWWKVVRWQLVLEASEFCKRLPIFLIQSTLHNLMARWWNRSQNLGQPMRRHRQSDLSVELEESQGKPGWTKFKNYHSDMHLLSKRWTTSSQSTGASSSTTNEMHSPRMRSDSNEETVKESLAQLEQAWEHFGEAGKCSNMRLYCLEREAHNGARLEPLAKHSQRLRFKPNSAAFFLPFTSITNQLINRLLMAIAWLLMA